MTLNAPIVFINEREYEAIKVGGLLREAEHAATIYNGAWNGVYQLDIYPAPIFLGTDTKSLDNHFYAILCPQDRKKLDSAIDDGVGVPEPGTPVQLVDVARKGQSIQKTRTLFGDGPKASNKWVGVVVPSPVLPSH
ncbi:hypothetical protein BJY00DRAFT_317638 [Aspergillus carlsbadensis]|nr:hypothetical protein BJY00DRAFT_317638 [Aspergillus carlsbadensis]